MSKIMAAPSASREEDAVKKLPDIVKTDWVDGRLVMFLSDGRMVPIVSGAEGEGDPPPDDDAEEEEEEDSEEEEEEEEDPSKIKDPQAKITALESANKRLARKNKKTEKDMGQIRQELQQLKDKDKSEEDKKNDEVKAKDDQIRTLQEDLTDANLKLLVLEHDKLAGLSPKRRAVIMRAVSDDLEVDDDDESNLDELIEDLEKADPALFKGEKVDDEEGDEEEEEEEGEPKKPRSTGKTPRRTPKGIKAASDRALAERFPALRRKIKRPAKESA